MEDLSLHILDVAENSIEAGASTVEIRIEEDTGEDRLILELRDNGKGLDEETRTRAADPFFTTKPLRRVGLGLSLLSQAAQECDGAFSITSEQGRGTTIFASFRRSHLDRKPLGDIAGTLVVLIATNPGIDFILTYKRDGYQYQFDTAEVRKDIAEIPINAPPVLKVIRECLDSGLHASQR